MYGVICVKESIGQVIFFQGTSVYKLVSIHYKIPVTALK